MAAQPDISIPTTSLSSTPKPYTLYNITIQLPLRPVTVPKRYSDFTALHTVITSQASSTPPPAPLPGKSWFTRTTSSPELTEQRRQGLEAYLRAINDDADDSWRNTSAWRTFLNLPSTTNSSKSSLQQHIASSGGAVTDPIVWLDRHRELKGQLHDARLALTKRDQAATTQTQHEASTTAKKCLVRAGTMIASLDAGLKEMGSKKFGEGEARRRRDIVAGARKERETLENLQSTMAAKAALDKSVASAESRGDLLDTNGHGSGIRAASHQRTGGGRVLGKETDRTRALSNQGVVQLQKQLMAEQDQDVEVLAVAVRKQKELGVQIQEELEVQKNLLDLTEQDVDRLQGKIGVARKRVGKIS